MSEIRLLPRQTKLFAQIFGAVLLTSAPAAAQQSLGPGSFEAYVTNGVDARVSDFSGLPVPRFASLRYGAVNGRGGPSKDYPVTWTYERAGLPVVIIRESHEWFKVQDPVGDEVWMHKSQLSAERTAITTNDGALRRNPDHAAGPMARFSPGAVVKLGECNVAWCRVEAEGIKGWAHRDQLWGDEDLPPARR